MYAYKEEYVMNMGVCMNLFVRGLHVVWSNDLTVYMQSIVNQVAYHEGLCIHSLRSNHPT